MSKPIPLSDFAIVVDREREHIVAAGPYSDMVSCADIFNLNYQTTAYVVRRWGKSNA